LRSTSACSSARRGYKARVTGLTRGVVWYIKCQISGVVAAWRTALYDPPATERVREREGGGEGEKESERERERESEREREFVCMCVCV